MPDVKRLYALRNHFPLIVDESDVLTELAAASYPIVVPADQAALRCTLVYVDPAGTPETNPNRVNDLTLKVTSPSGTVYWGNHGLLEGNWSIPGGAPNTLDTVENVFVSGPEAGAWPVEVLAAEINADARPETPDVDDADYALVVSLEPPHVTGDLDGDWDRDADDLARLAGCLTGPDLIPACGLRANADLDADGDCDLLEFAAFMAEPPTAAAGACCFPQTGACMQLTATACADGAGAYEGDGSTCAATVCAWGLYLNTVDPINTLHRPGAGRALADDLTLAGAGARGLTCLDLAVYSAGGGPFDVTIGLWTGCPGAGGALIPGTTFTWTAVPDDSRAHRLRVGPTTTPIATLPDTVWLVGTFSTDQAGWIVAGPAESGYTDNVYGRDDAPWNCERTFTSHYGGFWANLQFIASAADVAGDCAAAPPVSMQRIDAPQPLRSRE